MKAERNYYNTRSTPSREVLASTIYTTASTPLLFYWRNLQISEDRRAPWQSPNHKRYEGLLRQAIESDPLTHYGAVQRYLQLEPVALQAYSADLHCLADHLPETEQQLLLNKLATYEIATGSLAVGRVVGEAQMSLATTEVDLEAVA